MCKYEKLSIAKRKYVDYINKIILNKKLSHSYLIEIDDYSQDFSLIILFIAMILKNKSSYQLSDDDKKILNLLDQGNYPDLKIIEPINNNIKKSQLLELQKDFNNKSLLDGKRIYIIKEAEKLNLASANTILKFLEEPVDNVIAILITTNRYLVIDTILSRCQVLNLKCDYIDSSLSNYNIDLLECVLKPRNFFIRYKFFIEEVFVEKSIIKQFFIDIEKILILYINYYYKNSESISDDLISIFKGIDLNYLLNVISILEDELEKLDYNINYKLWLDSLFAKLIMGGFNDDFCCDCC